jgi:hypothetical protein
MYKGNPFAAIRLILETHRNDGVAGYIRRFSPLNRGYGLTTRGEHACHGI